jgi:UDP-N-acetylglucosamine 2-epimerase
MIIRFENVIEKEKPDLVIVFGDTNSTAAASIVAVKHGIKLAHVEAGLREFNKYIPEESNKLITDILADFYFCPTPTAVDILKNMGITCGVYNTGDVMIDIIEKYRYYIENNTQILDKLHLSKYKYVFVTCHRAANTDNPQNLKNILKAINSLNKKVVFPVHPRTQKIIKENNLDNLMISPYIIKTEPLSYFDSQTLIMYADYVITDSGGVTKEAYYHKVPGILVDTQTEWIETVNEGWNKQAGPNTEKILNFATSIERPNFHSNCLGDGHASEKIAKILLDNL